MLLLVSFLFYIIKNYWYIMESNFSRSNEDTQIYPYCYKIKENLSSKKTRCTSKCLKILAAKRIWNC